MQITVDSTFVLVVVGTTAAVSLAIVLLLVLVRRLCGSGLSFPGIMLLWLTSFSAVGVVWNVAVLHALLKAVRQDSATTTIPPPLPEAADANLVMSAPVGIGAARAAEHE